MTYIILSKVGRILENRLAIVQWWWMSMKIKVYLHFLAVQAIIYLLMTTK